MEPDSIGEEAIRKANIGGDMDTTREKIKSQMPVLLRGVDVGENCLLFARRAEFCWQRRT